ncbi:glycerate kinase [Lactobacillus psittaci]|nr:glycerate kinase [Lactobacillus psittaci]
MKFVIAPDSYKNCLSAFEVAKAIHAGINQIFPKAEYEVVPMADGGEGTTTALVEAREGKYEKVLVHNPFNQLVEVQYGFIDKQIAVIEVAAASGIQYRDAQHNSPLLASSYGTGEIILDALKKGAKKIVLGLGGSATVDGASGILQAIGAKFLDKNDSELQLGPANLKELAKIDFSEVDPKILKVPILLASDVTNPLLGEEGAAKVFAPQKGADAVMVEQLEDNLSQFAKIACNYTGKDYINTPGAGAAGGIGFGLLTFLNAKIEPGVKLIAKLSQLAEKCQHADYIFTGEGRTDFQTKFGKTPYGVAQVAKKVSPNAKVIIVSGSISEDADELCQNGIIDALFTAPVGAKSLDQAIKGAKSDITYTSKEIARLLKVNTSLKN